VTILLRGVEFHFVDFIARAKTIDIIPNHEIDSWGWFEPQQALKKLNLIDSTRDFIKKYENIKTNN
jgi:hypothetical protein